MTLFDRPCIITLAIVYPVFLIAGAFFYRWVIRNKPHRDAQRNKLLTVLRFLLYIVLLPLAVTIALALLGWLDPLFYLVRSMMAA